MIKLFIFGGNRTYFLQLFLCITYICQTWSNLRQRFLSLTVLHAKATYFTVFDSYRCVWVC